MDLDRIEAAVCSPIPCPASAVRRSWSKPDRELGLASVQAYNDWNIDEWTAGGGRGRLIPLTIVPLWDAELAAAEIRRCADKGSHAVSFTESPAPLGLPSLWDKDRFWDPVLPGLRRYRHHHLHAHRLLFEDADDVARRAR